VTAGATRSTRSFNPRAREGRDRRADGRTEAGHCFNPRAREGRDPVGTEVKDEQLCFNPRAREGRDPDWVTVEWPWDVSIHAPVKDATPDGYRFDPDDLFQSTRP